MSLSVERSVQSAAPLAFLAAALVPPALSAWVLWFAPVGPLAADRTALAARDYTALWGAGRAAVDHLLGVLSDPARFSDYLRSWFGAGLPEQIWPYPPPVLLIAAPLAQLPLGLGFAFYTLATLALLALTLRLIGLRRWAWLVLLSPAVAENAVTGQNGALTAALLVGALLTIDRRPVVAGVLLGALIIKPQLLLLLPICLIAGGRWRTILSALAASTAIVSLSILCFDSVAWVEYLSRARPMISAYIEAPWQANPTQLIFSSAFMAARSLGASLNTAYAVQAAIAAACAVAAWRVWRRPNVDPALRMSATIAFALAASPWVHSYDMPALAVSALVLIRHCDRRAWPILGFAWFWPGAVAVLPVPNLLALASVGSIAWLAGAAALDQAPPR